MLRVIGGCGILFNCRLAIISVWDKFLNNKRSADARAVTKCGLARIVAYYRAHRPIEAATRNPSVARRRTSVKTMDMQKRQLHGEKHESARSGQAARDGDRSRRETLSVATARSTCHCEGIPGSAACMRAEPGREYPAKRAKRFVECISTLLSLPQVIDHRRRHRCLRRQCTLARGVLVPEILADN